MPVLVMLPPNLRPGEGKTGTLAHPLPLPPRSRAVEAHQPCIPAAFCPVFVLAKSCSGLLEADSIKTKLEESGRGITEEGVERGFRWGCIGGRTVG